MSTITLTRARTNPLKPLRQVWSLLTPTAKSKPAPVRLIDSKPTKKVTPMVPQKKILIVDDDPILGRKLEVLLRGEGYAVMNSLDASGAIGAARKERPDLILLDLSFPPDVAHGGAVNWDGFLIMSWLKRFDETRQIPVVAISGSEEAKYRTQALAAGAAAFLRKPISHRQFLVLIQHRLRAYAASKQTEPLDFAI